MRKKWVLTGSSIIARRSHSTTLLKNGKVLAAGGVDGLNTILSSAELYDPATGLWTPTGSLGVARVDHTATILASGKVLVAGGNLRAPSGKAINSAELYDPATGQWSPTGSLKNARSSHTATRLRNGLVLAAGGTGDQDFPDRIDSAELYDSAIGEWISTASLTLDNGRTSHTAILLDNGMVLVVGGNTFGPFLASGAELYDPDNKVWTPTGNPITPRFNHAAVRLRNGNVLVVGGLKSNGLADELDSAELYDPASGKWTATGSLNTSRHQHTATLLRNGQVLVAGGFKDITNNPTLSSSELYDSAHGSWSTTAVLNKARGEHTATLLRYGKVLIVGGLVVGGREPGLLTLNSAELFSSA